MNFKLAIELFLSFTEADEWFSCQSSAAIASSIQANFDRHAVYKIFQALIVIFKYLANCMKSRLPRLNYQFQANDDLNDIPLQKSFDIAYRRSNQTQKKILTEAIDENNFDRHKNPPMKDTRHNLEV